MPTFNPRGDIVLVDHVSVTAGLIKVGDVVIARSVQNPRHVVCKRVLGMEGDYVEVAPPIQAGSSRRIKVRIGRGTYVIKVTFYFIVEHLDVENFKNLISFPFHKCFLQIPQGHVWLQGDNYYNSTDSRHYGPVPYAVLRGRVVVKVWPPWEFGWVKNQRPHVPTHVY